MISDFSLAVIVFLLAIILVFFIWSACRRQKPQILHRIYLLFTACYALWLLPLIGMRFTPADNIDMLRFLDCVTQIGPVCAVLYLWIAIVFILGTDRVPKPAYLLLILPIVNILICATNPLHHLEYIQFSVIRSEIVFGPFVMVSGIYDYLCMLTCIALMLGYAIKNSNSVYRGQCLLIAVGGILPPVVSAIATFGQIDLPITATPISFFPLIVLNYIALYPLHLLEMQPVATKQVMDCISDCYLVLSEDGLVMNYNKPFAKVFAQQFGITLNKYLSDSLKENTTSQRSSIYNLIAAVDSCRESGAPVSYEQSALIEEDGITRKTYYVADIAPLEMEKKKRAGYVIIFKDITPLKRSMEQLQESEKRMMEQERFAFLGQMIAGLAHNLKTPIMSISGCTAAVNDLISECEQSLDSPEVTKDDYREIYGEMRDWSRKILESTAYMSDIITLIKGSTVSGTGDSVFTLDELITRTKLLMKHELQAGGCTLTVHGDVEYRTLVLHGDMNNLVQVLGNLVANAVFAQKETGGGEIVLGYEKHGDDLDVFIADRGAGIPENVKARLFKEMVTSKGALGSGLGLYISNVVVSGKFGGFMWFKDNPGGGSIIGMTVPLNRETEMSGDGEVVS